MAGTHEGRVAIVTGAGSGLGRVMALALVDAGAAVVAADIDAQALAALGDEAGTEERLLRVAADVGRDESAQEIVGAAQGRFGRLDILVNNAGIGVDQLRPADVPHAPGLFRDVSPAEFRRVLEVNTVGPFLMARAAVAPMLAQGWGRIINVTTSLDTMWRKGMFPYGGSKAANEAHAVAIAEELAGTGVTLNILVPGGAAATRMTAKTFSGRNLIAADVMAAPLLWLTTPEADGITGQRFIAVTWDRHLPGRDAAQRCGTPGAWQQLGRQSIMPG